MARALYTPPPRFDLLRVPLLGRFLRWRHGRLTLQVLFGTVAALMLIDGFYGARFASGDAASENLATVLSWVHYRGVVVLALLLVGNLFCMGCPFTLPRTLAKRLSLRGRRFPRMLRNKWLSIAGLFGIFWLYEWLDLWSSPFLTAWVIVAYFVASFVLEAWFKESAFCKYVCPLGAFNFVYATASPTQIQVHQPDICRTCVGKECVNGSYAPQPVILIDAIGVHGEPLQTHTHSPQGTLGCGTELFAPRIQSNMDCTLCLDCVRACPHENVGLFVRPPLQELSAPNAMRATWDSMLLVILLAFMGITNAFGMVPPVYVLIEQLADTLGFLRAWGVSPFVLEGVVLLVLALVGNLLIPLALVFGAAWLTRALVRGAGSPREVVSVFAPAFVPLGFGIWIAHYGFHFLIGVWAIVPVMQSFLGLAPNYTLVGVPPDSVGLAVFEIAALLGGFALSLRVAQRRALAQYRRQGMTALMVWALLFLLMMVASVQIMGMDMEMRAVSELFADGGF